ncbi:MAG: hypothetical protein ACRC8S_10570 [Fimbriiglobus sp.]
MASPKRTDKTVDEVALQVLAYEFPRDDHREAETKIKRRLRYYDLGPYSQERIEMLRRFKNEVQAEISLFHRSKYYVRTQKDGYAKMEDFDTDRMASEYGVAYPEVRPYDVAAFISLAVFLYWMR